MSKVGSAIIAALFIILLTAFFYFSPRYFPQEAAEGSEAIRETLAKRFVNVGNFIAHSSFVIDAVIENQTGRLAEIIAQFRRDEPDLQYVHITNAQGTIIASSNDEMVGTPYESNILGTGPSVVREKSGVFEGGFEIRLKQTKLGVLYFAVRPAIPIATVSATPNPILAVVGIAVAVIVFIILLSMQRNLEAHIVAHINKRQEEVFSPKIESLKKEQEQIQQDVEDYNRQVEEARKRLQSMTEEYEARKKELESTPVMQSIDKLKETEAGLLKHLEKLKEEEQRLSKEITLLSQKREEVRSALEAEKKEEKTLHEKLDLIKKKILHLETPKK
jgi:cell division protein FtsB